jgi:integral membrane protein
VKSALTRYRVLAYATGVFLLLLTLHVLVQWYQASSEGLAFSEAPGLGRWVPGADRWVPITHGYLYLAYVIVTVDLWFRARLPLLRTALVVLAGTIPFMSFVAERWVTHQVRPLIAAAETPAAQRTATGEGATRL